MLLFSGLKAVFASVTYSVGNTINTRVCGKDMLAKTAQAPAQSEPFFFSIDWM